MFLDLGTSQCPRPIDLVELDPISDDGEYGEDAEELYDDGLED